MEIEKEKEEIVEFMVAMRREIAKRIRGYENEINLVLTALAASDHILFTGVPGLAKTQLARTVAEISGCKFMRIQLTSDMMPSDITGVEVWRPSIEDFEPREGPIVANIVLADEINRTTPKTQSALLEAMEEDSVTIGKHTIDLGPPFLVFATRNPIEQEGVYPLPEAQLDRFLFEIVFPYPEEEDEIRIAKQGNSKPVKVETLGSPKKLVSISDFTSKEVSISEEIHRYIVKIIRATREHSEIELGASPRASQKLVAASKAHALVVGGKTHVTPEDVEAVAMPLLTLRVVPKDNFLEEQESLEVKKDLIEEILKKARANHIDKS